MTTFQAILLGILQGVTEFLPVSSSGHLVLAEHLFVLEISPANLQSFDVLLHAGTLLALLLIYREQWLQILQSLWKPDAAKRPLLVLLILATIPGGAAGLLFEDAIAQAFRSQESVALMFLVTALVLLLGEMAPSKSGELPRPLHAILIGIAQAFAIIPGLSRSGLTISAGRAAGLSRREALDFSFLMAVPIMGGATLFILLDLLKGEVVLPDFSAVASGFLASTIASMIAILFLRKWVIQHSLSWFSIYLVLAAGILFL